MIQIERTSTRLLRLMFENTRMRRLSFKLYIFDDPLCFFLHCHHHRLTPFCELLIYTKPFYQIRRLVDSPISFPEAKWTPQIIYFYPTSSRLYRLRTAAADTMAAAK